jgi:hypothetical protein
MKSLHPSSTLFSQITDPPLKRHLTPHTTLLVYAILVLLTLFTYFVGPPQCHVLVAARRGAIEIRVTGEGRAVRVV